MCNVLETKSTVSNSVACFVQAHRFDGVVLEVWMQFRGDAKQ